MPTTPGSPLRTRARPTAALETAAQAAGCQQPEALAVVQGDSAAWGEPQARLAAIEAGQALGVDLADLALVRDVSTVVFRVRDLAVKVQPPTFDATRLHAAFTALAGCDVTLAPVTGPIATAHGFVTLWPWCAGGGAVRWPDIGRLLRELHDTAVPVPGLPAWRPLQRLPDQVAGLPDDVAGVLLDARDRLLAEVYVLTSDLGDGVIHGDVSEDNVLRHQGRPVFIDLDFVATGPKEYDLVGAALRRQRRQLSRRDYAAFCTAYGADVRSWSGFATVRAVCELGGLTFAVWAARHRGEELPDLRRRVARWR